MRRIFLLISILLLSVTWAMAQYGGSWDTAGSGDQSKVTVLGCLAEEGGNFTLTDQAGTTYQLVGKTEQLNAHVGHTIRVTGTNASAAQFPGAMGADAGTPPTLSVTSFKHVSSRCDVAPGAGGYSGEY